MYLLWTLQLLLSGSICTVLCQFQLATSGGVSIPIFRVPRRPSLLALSGFVPLSDANEFAYLVDVIFGGQSFQLILDTGSSDLWVVSSNCDEQDCQGVPRYNDTSSLNLSDVPFDLKYVQGSVSGTVGTETVSVGSFEISSQVFALASNTSGLDLTGTGNSGILGLSFAVEAAIPDTSGRTFLENILAAFSEDNRFFAFNLGRGQSNSSFTIGQLDTTYVNSTSNLKFHPVSSAGGEGYNYWKLSMQSLTINSTEFALSDSRVTGASTPISVLDTGTTLILGPTDDVDRFWQSIGASRKTDAGWEVQCDRSVIVGFVLGDDSNRQEYIIDPADLSWKEDGQDDGWCMGGIQANDGVTSGDWLLGDTFLRNVYVTHHVATSSQPPTIGLFGLTDPVSALTLFQEARGNDTNGPVKVLSSTHQSHGLGAGGICGIAVAAGFVLGAVVTFLSCRIRPSYRRLRVTH
ncbi:acid protease [Sparassis crispa]|uniref:Acid protease n=1 Tax=Sparassis crispa TaxID=139825 RepID=A0A401GJM1_9APHY|nr:acid protease [Sparassis crispa]GBE82352.1 acid protease [Sparassis crispa]